MHISSKSNITRDSNLNLKRGENEYEYDSVLNTADLENDEKS